MSNAGCRDQRRRSNRCPGRPQVGNHRGADQQGDHWQIRHSRSRPSTALQVHAHAAPGCAPEVDTSGGSAAMLSVSLVPDPGCRQRLKAWRRRSRRPGWCQNGTGAWHWRRRLCRAGSSGSCGLAARCSALGKDSSREAVRFQSGAAGFPASACHLAQRAADSDCCPGGMAASSVQHPWPGAEDISGNAAPVGMLVRPSRTGWQLQAPLPGG